jgi:hypothetical protein
MTSDLALKALKSWIEYRAALDLDELDGIPVYLRDNEAEKETPNITLRDTASEEHDVLRGVLTIQVEAVLETVPAETGQEGHTEEEHQAINSALFRAMSEEGNDDTPLAVAFCDGYTGLRVFDIRGTSPTTEVEDSNRVTRFEFQVVACLR